MSTVCEACKNDDPEAPSLHGQPEIMIDSFKESYHKKNTPEHSTQTVTVFSDNRNKTQITSLAFSRLRFYCEGNHYEVFEVSNCG